MKKLLTGCISIGGALSVLSASAQTRPLKDLTNEGLNYATAAGLGTKDVRETLFLIINIILGFLSIIAVIGILYGGFLIMTAGGDEDKKGSGKKAIVAGIIGLAIIFTAWAIAAFVVRSLVNVTAS